jgi:hypothetical protein
MALSYAKKMRSPLALSNGVFARVLAVVPVVVVAVFEPGWLPTSPAEVTFPVVVASVEQAARATTRRMAPALAGLSRWVSRRCVTDVRVVTGVLIFGSPMELCTVALRLS